MPACRLGRHGACCLTAWQLLLSSTSVTQTPTTCQPRRACCGSEIETCRNHCRNVHTKATLWGAWTAVPSSCCVKHIVQMQDGTFIALAGNGNIMTLDSLGSTYVTLPNLDPKLVVKSIAVPGAGAWALGSWHPSVHSSSSSSCKGALCVCGTCVGRRRAAVEGDAPASGCCSPVLATVTGSDLRAASGLFVRHMPDAHKTRLALIESCKLNAHSRHLPGACREDDHRQDPGQDAAGQ
jgi:hypothetical protein